MLSGHIEVAYDSNFAGIAKLYLIDANGQRTLRHTLPMHNATVADGYGHNGHCPAGDYYLGEPQSCATHQGPPGTADYWTPVWHNDDDQAYGYWFTPLIDANGLWQAEDRAGIGCHGGGSASPAPFAAQQGWFPTEGCNRMQNEDNETFVGFVRYIRASNPNPDQAVKFTVLQAA